METLCLHVRVSYIYLHAPMGRVLSFKKSGFYDLYTLQIFVREVLITYYYASRNIIQICIEMLFSSSRV